MASPRSGSGAATTSRPASTPWSCGRGCGDGLPAGAGHRDVLRRDGHRAGPRARPARRRRRVECGRARAFRWGGARGGQPGGPGGVAPEVASRAHLESMIPTFDRALATAGVRPGQIDAVAVTAGPGLAGALLVGVAAAQRFSFALGKP